MAYNTRYRAQRRKLEELQANAAEHAVLSAAEELPAEMFYQIFQYLDKKSLKKSREVCKTWRNTIDGNPKLMKSLTVDVTSINKFLQSNLATKVKSVCFTLPLTGREELLEEFFTVIGPTVEKVILKFVENKVSCYYVDYKADIAKKMERQKLMFSMMLRFCTKLNSLTIKSTDDNYDFVKNCGEHPTNNLVLSKIKDLSINVRTRYLEDLGKLVKNLPNLHRLILNFDFGLVGDFVDYDELCNLVLDHLRKYNGKLQEIILEECFDDGDFVIKLLLMVGKLFPNTSVKCQASLNMLVNFKESEDIQVNQQSCSAIKSGLIVFENNHYQPAAMDTSRIGFCANLQSLDIEISQRISLVNFGFIEALKKLEFLRIRSRFQDERDDNFLIQQFPFGIPSLTAFDIDFESKELGLNSFSIHLFFPNLAKLHIRNYPGDLNQDFIKNLTNLDQLRSLTFEHLEELTDEHLTRVYDFTEDIKITKLPAIAGFKSLRHLHIANCVQLTDNCLTNGLALCTKLDKITLCYKKYGAMKGKLTKRGLSFLQEARNYFVEDLQCSHYQKHSLSSWWLRKNNVFKRFTTLGSASVVVQ